MYQEKVDASPHTPGKKDVPLTYKKQVWSSYYGGVITRAICPCCMTYDIERDDHQLGHIHPESRGGTDLITNVRPICKECNTLMGATHLYTFAWRRYGRILWPTA